MSSRSLVIDAHHHWMPPDHLHAVEKFMRGGDAIRRKDGTLSVLRNGVPVHNMDEALIANVDAQIADMDDAGVDVAVLSLGLWLEWITSLPLARAVNDELAEIQRRSGGRFIGCAHVPPLADGAQAELVRAVRDLGLGGVNLNTHVQGKYLHHPDFRPVLRTIADLDVPVVLHASTNAPVVSSLEGDGTMLSRVMDQTALTVYLISSGLLEELPALRFIIPHMGGSFFAIRKRIGFGYWKSPLTPHAGALERMWFDTAPGVWDPIDIAYCVGNSGARRTVFGTDYPTFQPWMKRAAEVARAAVLSMEHRDALMGGNAAELFHLQPVQA
ncbi:MAG TPA: amidohydrolase family protein [Anaerolineales bacterium]|nr:amidohydrolase family protein [Anaerolineales bacterium]